MKAKRKIIKARSVLIALILLPLSISQASQVQQRLALWRGHILSKGNFAGVELNSEHYRALVEMGPNCLPEVFEAYRRETDPHVLYYYRILIGRVGHFDFFRYSIMPLKIMGYQYQCTVEKPFLSMEVREKGLAVLRYPQRAFWQRDKLIAWWDQRSSFLQRSDAVGKVKAITGSTAQEFLRYDKIKARQLFKLNGYGIYNIPYFIDIIEKDNNPVVFCEFLRISNHPAYQQLDMRSDVVSNTNKADAAYPTRQSKVELICNWWDNVGETYTNLEGLYLQIDSRVKKLRDRMP